MLRKLLKGGNYSREETIRGNTVIGFIMVPFKAKFVWIKNVNVVVQNCFGSWKCLFTNLVLLQTCFCSKLCSQKLQVWIKWGKILSRKMYDWACFVCKYFYHFNQYVNGQKSPLQTAEKPKSSLVHNSPPFGLFMK